MFTVTQIDPWVCASLDELGQFRRSDDRLKGVGAKNDIVTLACLVRTDRACRATMNCPRGELCIVGFGRSRTGEAVPDALFRQPPKVDASKFFANGGHLKQPMELEPGMPAMLWLTAPSPSPKFDLTIESGGTRIRVPVEIETVPIDLPKENPLKCFLWQTAPTGVDWAPAYVKTGVNVFNRGHAAAKKAGAQFFLFNAPDPVFMREAMSGASEAKAQEQLKNIEDQVRDLKLRRDQCAVYLTDEPPESDLDRTIEWLRWMRRRSTNLPIYLTLPWGPGPANTKMSATGVRRLIAEQVDIYQPYWHYCWDGSGCWTELKRSGKPLWIYEIVSNAARQKNCGVSWLRKGFYRAYEYGAQGVGVYAAYDPRGNAWEDAPGRTGYWLHYSDGDLVSSRALEAFRQGVQDFKLISALKGKAPKRWLDEQVNAAIAAKTGEEMAKVRETLLRFRS